MARHPRLVVPGIALHVVQRGVDRQACFFTDADREFYLGALTHLAAYMRCAIHAYVLMTNHVHLLLTPEQEAGPGQLLQALGRRYVRHVRYIDLNPVRARMVAQPEDYRWSSHCANAGIGDAGALTPHPALEALRTGVAERRLAYRELFVREEVQDHVEAIRRMTHGNYALGTPRFAEQIAAMLGRRASPGRRGRPARLGVEDMESRSRNKR